MKTKCEVYSRVVGYIRPVQQWNDGKQAEFYKRKTFDINKALCRSQGGAEEACSCVSDKPTLAIEVKA